jgi:RNA polymerase-interacting CarD/CdnL/TRCF family regulator
VEKPPFEKGNRAIQQDDSEKVTKWESLKKEFLDSLKVCSPDDLAAVLGS